MPDISPLAALIALAGSLLLDLTVTGTFIFLYRLHKANTDGVMDASENRLTPSGLGWLNDHHNHVFRYNYNRGIRKGTKMRPKVLARYDLADSRGLENRVLSATHQKSTPVHPAHI